MKQFAFAAVLCVCAAAGVFAVDEHWVTTWGCGPQLTEPQNMPPSPGLSGNTLRQSVHLSIGGKRLRVQFSNAFGRDPVEIVIAYIAVSAGNGAFKPDTHRALSFGGGFSITIPPNEAVWSDPLDFNAAAMSDLAVSICFGQVPKSLTGHPGSRTTSYIQAGNAVAEPEFSSPSAAEHWYILTRIDVATDGKSAALVIIGDSITDGRGSTTNGNDRWPDNLSRRLQATAAGKRIAVVNMGIGGGSVHSGGLGPTALKRFDRDVLDVAGVRWLIILEGVNDIGGSGKYKADDITARMIAAYQEMIDKAHKAGIKVFGVPILPFGGSQYDMFEHEAARKLINEWVRTPGHFDGVIDLDAVMRDPAEPDKLLDTLHMGDHLHPNKEGHRKLADGVNLKLFK